MDGSCHCGAVRWRFTGRPESATVCNCTLCRRYGTLWAYGHEGEDIEVSGHTRSYRWGNDTIAFHFCGVCGCVAWWRANTVGRKHGKRRIAVNLRLAEPEAFRELPIDRFDGLATFEDLPRDGRCAADYLF